MDKKKQFIPLNAVATLTACGQVQTAQCLLEQAVVAYKKLEGLSGDHFDRPFYEGKIAAARYYANQLLPNVLMLAQMIASEDAICLECPEEALVVT
jgi:hypothetical protein